MRKDLHDFIIADIRAKCLTFPVAVLRPKKLAEVSIVVAMPFVVDCCEFSPLLLRHRVVSLRPLWQDHPNREERVGTTRTPYDKRPTVTHR